MMPMPDLSQVFKPFLFMAELSLDIKKPGLGQASQRGQNMKGLCPRLMRAQRLGV